MENIEKLLQESTLFLGVMLDSVDEDPKAIQFFDLRVIAAVKKHLIEVNELAKERGW